MKKIKASLTPRPSSALSVPLQTPLGMAPGVNQRSGWPVVLGPMAGAMDDAEDNDLRRRRTVVD